MYFKEDLVKYSYFEKLLLVQDISTILDPLTGLVSRSYILSFIRHLIDEKIPFTVALLDLDNFKFINDTQGHKIGDEVLAAFGGDIIKYLGDIGLAGRYGGDEFVIINFRDKDYDSVKQFYLGMYSNYTVLRKNIELGSIAPFLTGTLGSATFPTDASDYESLFALIDKTLYRGKRKGRNCYIIYLEEKHKDIQITELAKRGVGVICNDLAIRFDAVDNLHGKLENMLAILFEDMRISNLFYIDLEHKIKRVGSDDILGEIDEIDTLFINNIYTPNNMRDFKDLSKGLYEYCKNNLVSTVLVVKISVSDDTYGYLMCAEPRSERIWQDDEEAILFFTARMIADYMKLTGEKL